VQISEILDLKVQSAAIDRQVSVREVLSWRPPSGYCRGPAECGSDVGYLDRAFRVGRKSRARGSIDRLREVCLHGSARTAKPTPAVTWVHWIAVHIIFRGGCFAGCAAAVLRSSLFYVQMPKTDASMKLDQRRLLACSGCKPSPTKFA
jgi:hypothetical protein